jgi:prepilin-type N-terminal cleavage/methylation domain-containing protein
MAGISISFRRVIINKPSRGFAAGGLTSEMHTLAKTLTKTSSQRGLTLVELLVALTLFTLLAGITMTSISTTIGLVRHTRADYAQKARTLSALRDSIASTFYYAKKTEGRHAERYKLYEDFFIGETESMTYVTMAPLEMQGSTLSHLFQEGENLILMEDTLYQPQHDYLNPDWEKRSMRKINLLGDVDKFSLRYLVDDKWLDRIEDEIPDAIEIQFYQQDRNHLMYVKLGSDYHVKVPLINLALSPI